MNFLSLDSGPKAQGPWDPEGRCARWGWESNLETWAQKWPRETRWWLERMLNQGEGSKTGGNRACLNAEAGWKERDE